MFLNTKCVFWFFVQILSETFFILKRNKWNVIINVHLSSCSCQILIELEFSGEIFEKPLNITVHEIFSVGAELFHADRRTHTTKFIVGFCKFAKAPKGSTFCPQTCVFNWFCINIETNMAYFQYSYSLELVTDALCIHCEHSNWVFKYNSY